MQPVHPLRFWRDVNFEPKGGERLLHPKCSFRRCSRGDTQRRHILSVECLRRKVFKTRNAAAETRAEPGLLQWVLRKREVPKKTQMPPPR